MATAEGATEEVIEGAVVAAAATVAAAKTTIAIPEVAVAMVMEVEVLPPHPPFLPLI